MQSNTNHYPLPSEQQTPTSQLNMSQQNMSMQQQNPYPCVQPYSQPIQIGQQLPQPQQQVPVMAYPQQPYMGQAVQQMIQIPSSRYPQILNCQICKRPVQTIVHYEAGNGAYVIGGMMAAVGLWLGCCLIPCFMDDCKDAVHFCPQCSAQVGRKKFLFE